MRAYRNNGSWDYVGDSVIFTSSNASSQSYTMNDVTIFRSVLISFMISVTSTGNALVILGFITNKKLRTPSNYFLLNLAISDFLTGTFCLPLFLKNFIMNRRWVLGKNICKIWLTVDCTLCQCTIYNIVLISSDRFLAVTKAVKYRDQQHNLRPAFMKMAAVWILAFLTFGPAIIIWEYVVGYSVMPDGACSPEFRFGSRYLLYSSVFDFFTPMSAIAFFNFSIYFNIRNRTRSKVQNTDHISNDLYEHRRSNNIYTIDCTDKLSKCPLSSTQCNQEIGAEENKKLRNEQTNGNGVLDQTKNSALARDKKIAKSLAVLAMSFRTYNYTDITGSSSTKNVYIHIRGVLKTNIKT
ncbi:histamine H3 receptor-like [Leptodactylus fuscus]|uniref:histamine H3 receptor-like n=1 Tax=Leptodactylus fuscus TaxID=238119 RepID=UPI003F4F0D13